MRAARFAALWLTRGSLHLSSRGSRPLGQQTDPEPLVLRRGLLAMGGALRAASLLSVTGKLFSCGIIKIFV